MKPRTLDEVLASPDGGFVVPVLERVMTPVLASMAKRESLRL